MELITDTAALRHLSDKLARNAYVTVDTEFMRETTFWPELCLIQIAGADIEAIIDPLAEGLNLAPFFELMADEDVVKVFHAARQDIEIVHNLSGLIPKPIFDTQVAAMVCGFGDSISYSNLVKKTLNVDIDKTSQFTDWRARPLSERQLKYALGDVTHLRGVYETLASSLERSGRAHWLSEEMAMLTAPTTYETHPEDAWKRLKMRVKSRKALGIMMEVAAWRETTAQRQNIPRSRVLKDEAVYDIANQAPRDARALASLRTIGKGFAHSRRGEEVVAAVARGLQRDPATIPPLKKGTPLSGEALAIVDLLRVHLKAVAAENGVAPKLLATTEDLERIAQEADADVPALKGWRRELFGESALALKRGDLALSVVDGAVATLPTPGRG